MEALQVIGLVAIIFVLYKFVYLPYTSRKKEEKDMVDKKIEILSYWHREMGDLFRPHINTAYEEDDDGNYVQTKGWAKVFNRVLYFSHDSELNEFRTKAHTLYNSLDSNPQTKTQIEKIFKEHGEYSEKQQIEKTNKFLQLRTNLLEYKRLMAEIFPNSETQLEGEEIIKRLSERLQLSNHDASQLFEKLSHHTTGIIFWSSRKDNGKNLYRYDESFIDRKTINDIR